MSNYEVIFPSTFLIPCSIFDILFSCSVLGFSPNIHAFRKDVMKLSFTLMGITDLPVRVSHALIPPYSVGCALRRGGITPIGVKLSFMTSLRKA